MIYRIPIRRTQFGHNQGRGFWISWRVWTLRPFCWKESFCHSLEVLQVLNRQSHSPQSFTLSFGPHKTEKKRCLIISCRMWRGCKKSSSASCPFNQKSIVCIKRWNSCHEKKSRKWTKSAVKKVKNNLRKCVNRIKELNKTIQLTQKEASIKYIKLLFTGQKPCS